MLLDEFTYVIFYFGAAVFGYPLALAGAALIGYATLDLIISFSMVIRRGNPDTLSEGD